VSWFEAIHLAISAVIFLIVYVEGNDEEFWLRFGSAAFVALFWLPGLILLVLMLVADWVGGKLKGRHK
jgi:hypothetical protein